jgi:N-dimethylarginine dimethylaminohydrolase
MSVGDRPRVAMCRPDFFEVSYTINPWMQPGEWSANRGQLEAAARTQWERLHDGLSGLGAEVALQPAQPGVPDMVFTANAATVLDGKALLARFHDAERQAEEPHDAAFFAGLVEQGVLEEVVTLPEGMFQEGAGDCLWDTTRRMFWAGYGQRSLRAAYEIVEDTFGRPVTALELVNPRYYHVDTCLAVLNSGHIVYFPPAFSDEGIAALEREAGKEFLIPAGEEDASQLGVNFVNIGESVVMSVCSEQLERRLNAAGFDVVRAPLPAFCLSGGAAACLTLRLDFRSDGAAAKAGIAA